MKIRENINWNFFSLPMRLDATRTTFAQKTQQPVTGPSTQDLAMKHNRDLDKYMLTTN